MSGVTRKKKLHFGPKNWFLGPGGALLAKNRFFGPNFFRRRKKCPSNIINNVYLSNIHPFFKKNHGSAPEAPQPSVFE